jgi:uncharacterized protein YfaS (alpha-2-macroglobulin family)
MSQEPHIPAPLPEFNPPIPEKILTKSRARAKWVWGIVALLVVMAILKVLAPLGINEEEAEAAATDTPFAVAQVAYREYDGLPALSVSFNLPLSSNSSNSSNNDWAQLIQVLEMPPAIKNQDEEQKEEGDEEENRQTTPSDAGASDAVDIEQGVLVKGHWLTTDNPRLIYFTGIKPNTLYVVRILPSIKAKGGRTLDQEVRRRIVTDRMAPSYYFASKGVVLMPEENGGLPITTVNVPEVDIQFLRVRPEHINAFLERVAETKRPKNNEEGDTEEEDRDEENYDYGQTKLQGAVYTYQLNRITQYTESVYAGRFLADQQKNRRSTTFIPVEKIAPLREPGIYIAVMTRPNAFGEDFQATYFYVSDLGLQWRRYNKEALVLLHSLKSGKPLADAVIEFWDSKGRVLSQKKTDSDGLANFAEVPKSAKVLVAKLGEQLSLLMLHSPSLDLSEFSITGNNYSSARFFAYSGRNVYRPGEQMNVSVMARSADGAALPSQPVQVTLRKPDGKSEWVKMWHNTMNFPNYYHEKVDLPVGSATGSWSLEFRADPANIAEVSKMNFWVEEFLPEKMKLDIKSEATILSGAEKEWALSVSGKYLYGADAVGNRVLGVATIWPNYQPFGKQWPGFFFGDINEQSERHRIELKEEALNEKGNGQFSINLSSLSRVHSPYSVRATLSLLESGGRPVIRNVERVYLPNTDWLGVRPLFERDTVGENQVAQFELIRVNSEGQAQSADRLDYTMFRENRDYYWRYDASQGWHSGFTENEEIVFTSTVTLANKSRAKISMPVVYGRYRLEVTNTATSAKTVYRFYAGWSARDEDNQAQRPDRVAMKLDRENYNNGDNAQLTFTPPHDGVAFITVEGDKLLWHKQMSAKEGENTVTIPVSKDWLRHDLYVNVTVFRAAHSSRLISPNRAVGVVHLPLSRASQKLTLNIEAATKIEPSSPLKVKIKANTADGRVPTGNAWVTLSAVDVGILNITQYSAPDPFAFFFSPLRYGTDIQDMYGKIIESLRGQVGSLKWGGDSGGVPRPQSTQKVKLIDLFSGPVVLDAQGMAEVSLDLPDFNGTLKLMAVAATPNAFGSAQTEVVVASPIVAELSLPRYLNLGDSANLALDIHNLSGSAKTINVTINADEGINIPQKTHSLNLKNGQKSVVRVPLSTNKHTGLKKVKVRIDSGDRVINRELMIAVQAPTPRSSKLIFQSVGVGETFNLSDLAGENYWPDTVLGSIAVSNVVPIDVRSAVRGLVGYPYGCAEQTTSGTYPYLFVDEKIASAYHLKTIANSERAKIVGIAFAKLSAYQSSQGSFSLWGGQVNESDYWLSAYVTQFLLSAKQNSFVPPPNMERKATEYLLKGLQEGVSSLPSAVNVARQTMDGRSRYMVASRFGALSFGAYVLAQYNLAPLSTLRQLHAVRAHAYSPLNLIHLGIALSLAGDDGRGQTTIEEALTMTRQRDDYVHDYGSDLRDEAMAFALLVKHDKAKNARASLLPKLSAQLQDKKYFSTQEQMALLHVGLAINQEGQSAKKWTADIAFEEQTTKIKGEGSWQSEWDVLKSPTLRLTNQSETPLYLSVNVSGHPRAMPAEKKDFFTIKKDWYAADGKPISAKSLSVGESAVVVLTINAIDNTPQGLIVDYLPAGVEIENINLQAREGESMSYGGVYFENMRDRRIVHTEYRDDRFVAAVKMNQGEATKLIYRVRAVTPGQYVIPPTFVEDMYRPYRYGVMSHDTTMEVKNP